MGILTFDQLEAAIQKHITKDAVTGGTLSLSSDDAINDLLSPNIGDVFSKSLEQATLLIKNISYSSSSAQQTVTVVGDGSAAPFAGLHVTAVFELDTSGQVQATASALSNTGPWTFAQGCPTLKGTIYEHAQFTNPQFVLSSTGSQKGLSFSGTFPVTGVLSVLTDLINGASEFQVSGQVTLTDGIPNMTLTAPLTKQTTAIGHLNIPINFGLVSMAMQNQRPDAQPLYWAYAFAQLSSAISYEHNGKTVSIPISAGFDSQSVALDFEADLSSFSKDTLEVGLGDFDSFFHKENISGLIPHEFPSDPLFTLSRLDISVSLAPKPQLTWLTLGISQDSPWQLVGDTVKIEGIDIQFDLTNPLAPDKQLFLAMSGNIVLDSNSTDLNPPFIHISMGYPFGKGNFYINGELEGEIDLVAAVKHFMPKATNLPTGLMLEELKLYAEPGGSAYSVSLAIKSDWNINVGVATLSLVEAGANVNYSKSATPPTTGEILAIVKIDEAEFEIDWQIPGEFHFNGVIPQIDLESLANNLCGSFMTLPKGFPDIVFNNAQVAITIASGSQEGTSGASYDLSLDTDVTVPSIGDLGTALFELRKDDSGFGFVVGFISPDNWSPASIWSGLQNIFGWLTFSDTALIISSLKQATIPPTNVKVPSLPTSVQQGVTFCTTIELGNSLGLLANLFDSLGGLTLVAIFDPDDPTKTKFTASMGKKAAGKGVVSYDGFSLTFAPGEDSISVTAEVGGNITIGGKQGQPADVLLIEGGGTLALAPTSTSVSFNLLMTGATKTGGGGTTTTGWNNPFGINPKLTVLGVGIVASISADGFKFTVGGSIEFTDPSVSNDPDKDHVVLTVIMDIVNGDDPGGFIASLTSDAPNGVSLASLVDEFTDLDLNWVPLLNDIRLKTLDFYLVDDPTGFPDPLDPTKLLQPGFSINADVIVFGVEADMDIEVLPAKGIKADGFLSDVISLGDVLTISDETGTRGINGKIDTTALTGPSSDGKYLYLSGKVSLFDNVAGAALLAYIEKNVFTFYLDYHVPPIKDFVMRCSINGLDNFYAGATLHFGLDNRTVDLIVDGSDLGTLTLPHIDITADFQLKLIKETFSLTIAANFEFEQTQPQFDFTITESFSDLAKLVETTFEHLAASAWELFKDTFNDINKLFDHIGQDLMQPGKDFGRLMRDHYNKSLDEVMQFFKGINYDAQKFVATLKEGFEVGDADIAKALQKAGYDLNQIADGLANGLHTVDKDGAQILYDLGYDATDIQSALTAYFRTPEDEAKQIVDGIFSDAHKFCAAEAYARATQAPDDDLEALRKLRADMENSPAGSKAQWYLELYNQYSARVHQLITNPGPVKDRITADDGQQLWNEIVAAVASAQTGSPTTMPDEENKALDILAIMIEYDSNLAAVVDQVWPDIQNYEGMTYSEFLQAAQAPHVGEE